MRQSIARLIAFARRHIELFGIVPWLLCLLAFAWFVTWTRGLPVAEVGPILTDYVVGLIPVALLGYLAWRFKAEYWYDLSDEEEKQLHASAVSNWRAFWLIVKDRVEWLVMFLVLFFAFSSFAGASTRATECTSDLLVRWEITSERAYERRYRFPIWPGGASGVTWGVGYDGGHQPSGVILREWIEHPQRQRLSTTAGLIGRDAQAALPRYRDIPTEWEMAVDVLQSSSIPRYRAAARRAYGRHFEVAPAEVQCALTSETYNRGESMAGQRREERRVIRDECLPLRDWMCVAEQLEASCRVWANDAINGPGLCNRRRNEASVVRSIATGGWRPKS